MAKKAKVIVDETTAEEKAIKAKKDSLMTKIVDKSVTGPSKILTRKWRDKDLTRHKLRL